MYVHSVLFCVLLLLSLIHISLTSTSPPSPSPLSGAGVTFEPSIVDFGDSYLYHVVTSSVKLSNHHSSDVTLVVSCLSSQFHLLSPSHHTLAPSSSLTLSLSFHPSYLSAHTSTLYVTVNTLGSYYHLHVPLRGMAVPSPFIVALPRPSLIHTSLVFRYVLSLKNTLGIPFAITNVTCDPQIKARFVEEQAWLLSANAIKHDVLTFRFSSSRELTLHTTLHLELSAASSVSHLEHVSLPLHILYSRDALVAHTADFDVVPAVATGAHNRALSNGVRVAGITIHNTLKTSLTLQDYDRRSTPFLSIIDQLPIIISAFSSVFIVLHFNTTMSGAGEFAGVMKLFTNSTHRTSIPYSCTVLKGDIQYRVNEIIFNLSSLIQSPPSSPFSSSSSSSSLPRLRLSRTVDIRHTFPHSLELLNAEIVTTHNSFDVQVSTDFLPARQITQANITFTPVFTSSASLLSLLSSVSSPSSPSHLRIITNVSAFHIPLLFDTGELAKIHVLDQSLNAQYTANLSSSSSSSSSSPFTSFQVNVSAVPHGTSRTLFIIVNNVSPRAIRSILPSKQACRAHISINNTHHQHLLPRSHLFSNPLSTAASSSSIDWLNALGPDLTPDDDDMSVFFPADVFTQSLVSHNYRDYFTALTKGGGRVSCADDPLPVIYWNHAAIFMLNISSPSQSPSDKHSQAVDAPLTASLVIGDLSLDVHYFASPLVTLFASDMGAIFPGQTCNISIHALSRYAHPITLDSPLQQSSSLQLLLTSPHLLPNTHTLIGHVIFKPESRYMDFLSYDWNEHEHADESNEQEDTLPDVVFSSLFPTAPTSLQPLLLPRSDVEALTSSWHFFRQLVKSGSNVSVDMELLSGDIIIPLTITGQYSIPSLLNSLDFNDTEVGARSQLSLPITNPSDQTLFIRARAVPQYTYGEKVGRKHNPFTVTGPTCIVPPRQTIRCFTVTFSPLSSGSFSSLLTLKNNLTTQSVVIVRGSGARARMDIGITPLITLLDAQPHLIELINERKLPARLSLPTTRLFQAASFFRPDSQTVPSLTLDSVSYYTMLGVNEKDIASHLVLNSKGQYIPRDSSFPFFSFSLRNSGSIPFSVLGVSITTPRQHALDYAQYAAAHRSHNSNMRMTLLKEHYDLCSTSAAIHRRLNMTAVLLSNTFFMHTCSFPSNATTETQWHHISFVPSSSPFIMYIHTSSGVFFLQLEVKLPNDYGEQKTMWSSLVAFATSYVSVLIAYILFCAGSVWFLYHHSQSLYGPDSSIITRVQAAWESLSQHTCTCCSRARKRMRRIIKDARHNGLIVSISAALTSIVNSLKHVLVMLRQSDKKAVHESSISPKKKDDSSPRRRFSNSNSSQHRDSNGDEMATVIEHDEENEDEVSTAEHQHVADDTDEDDDVDVELSDHSELSDVVEDGDEDGIEAEIQAIYAPGKKKKKNKRSNSKSSISPSISPSTSPRPTLPAFPVRGSPLQSSLSTAGTSPLQKRTTPPHSPMELLIGTMHQQHKDKNAFKLNSNVPINKNSLPLVFPHLMPKHTSPNQSPSQTSPQAQPIIIENPMIRITPKSMMMKMKKEEDNTPPKNDKPASASSMSAASAASSSTSSSSSVSASSPATSSSLTSASTPSTSVTTSTSTPLILNAATTAATSPTVVASAATSVSTSIPSTKSTPPSSWSALVNKGSKHNNTSSAHKSNTKSDEASTPPRRSSLPPLHPHSQSSSTTSPRHTRNQSNSNSKAQHVAADGVSDSPQRVNNRGKKIADFHSKSNQMSRNLSAQLDSSQLTDGQPHQPLVAPLPFHANASAYAAQSQSDANPDASLFHAASSPSFSASLAKSTFQPMYQFSADFIERKQGSGYNNYDFSAPSSFSSFPVYVDDSVDADVDVGVDDSLLSSDLNFPHYDSPLDLDVSMLARSRSETSSSAPSAFISTDLTQDSDFLHILNSVGRSSSAGLGANMSPHTPSLSSVHPSTHSHASSADIFSHHHSFFMQQFDHSPASNSSVPVNTSDRSEGHSIFSASLPSNSTSNTNNHSFLPFPLQLASHSSAVHMSSNNITHVHSSPLRASPLVILESDDTHQTQ